MGLFGRFAYSNGQWRDDPVGDRYLVVDIHDSDIAAVQYAPTTGRGLFFLGFEPRDYFDAPDASDPVDREREAVAFVEWVRTVVGREVDAWDVVSVMAEPGAEEPIDVFVEDTVVTLLDLVGLPPPDW